LIEAKNSFAKDIIYRKWVAIQGGVYVPVSKFTPPNPHLNVPYRDVETKEGLKLTLVNPAYMTRMVHGLESQREGVVSHIVSLNPLNPVNKPDKWEEAALKEIEKGIEEKHGLQLLNNKKYLRYISAFKVEEPCLKCHAQQGYKVGDVKGGISVSIPFSEYEQMLSKNTLNLFLSHSGAAIITLIVLFVGASSTYRKNKKLINRERQITEIVNNSDIGYWDFDIANNKLIINKEWAEKVGYEFPESGNKIEFYIARVHEEDASKSLQILDDLRNGRISEFSLEHRIKCKDGNYKWMLSKGKVIESKKGIPLKLSGIQIDIDKDKKMVEEILKQSKELNLIFDYSPLPTSISSLEDGKFLAVNKAWELLSGFSNSEVVGKTSIELGLWKNSYDRQNFVQQISQNGFVNGLEFEFYNRQKLTIPARVSASIVEINNKKYIISVLKDISEQKKFERKLKKEKELYSYFNYIHLMIDQLDEKNFYDLSIEYLVKLTDSKIGFFHAVSEDQKEVILTTWSQGAKDFCKSEYKSHYPINEAGNWVDCLKTKKAVIYNDYKNSPNQKGLPLGHVQIEKFMSIATFVNDKPYLIFGVGNKEDDYDETDAMNIELFASELSKLIEKKNFINKIKENERFISSIINNLPGFVYRCANDKNWTMYYLSENTINFIGYKEDELINNQVLSYNDLILPEYQQMIWDKIQESIKADLPYEFEYQIVKKDGNIIWVWERGRSVKDKNGNLLFLEGFITDIDEKKKLQNAISESEKKYRLLVEEMYQGLAVHQAIYDKNGNMVDYKFIDMNKSFENMLGIKKEDLLNKTVLEVMPETEKYWIETYEKVVKTGEPIEYENYSKEFDKYFHVIAYNNQLDQFATIVTDITQQKKLQMRIEESEKRFRRIVDSSQDIIFELNMLPEPKYVFISDSVTKVMGYTPEEFYEDAKLAERLIHPDDFNSFIENIFSGKKDKISFTIRYKAKSGDIKWIEHNINPSYNEMNELIKLEGISRDVTLKKEYEIIIVESEAKYRRLFESMTAGFVLFEIITNDNKEPVDLLIVAGNEVFAKTTGLTLSKAVGKKITEVLPGIENDPAGWIHKYSKVAFTGQHITFEEYSDLLHKYFTVSAFQPEQNRCAVTFIDITEKKLAEQELRRQKQRLEDIIHSTDAATWEWNIQTGEIIVNDQWAEMLGFTLEEIKPNNIKVWDSLCHPDDLKRSYDLINKHIRGEIDSYECECRIKTKTGDWKWVLDKGKIFSFTKDGKPEWMFGIHLDITERKKRETEILTLSRAIEQSPVSVVITDTSGKIVFVNKYFSEVTGYSAEEVIGQNPRILSAGKHSKAFYENMWRTISSGNSWEGLFYNKKKNGTKYWESAIISPIRDENNQIIFYVGVKEDITEDLMKEEQLQNYREKLEKLVEERTRELQNVNEELVEQIKKERELEAQLQEALLKEKDINELKVRFFASVSHEFRTPLAGILTSAQMIQRYGKKWSEEKLLDHFRNIEKTVVQLTKLLDDILLISKADREILKNNPREENIGELFKNIIEQHYATIQKGRKINFTNNCPSISYSVDPKLLNHTVGNLLANSIKFGFEGTDVNLTLEEIDKQLVIKVQDKGIGIPEEDIKKIFEPFYRTSNSASFKGAGLGLNIVKRCVEILKGKIEVESKVNEGSIFTVRIPIYDK
jgi:PAS domain S-box-containing protein